MTMTCGDCCTTLIWEPDVRLPAACALARNTWTADMTSGPWVAYASPKVEVQLRFFAMLSSTDGNCVIAFTLGSHGCESTACIRGWPVRELFWCRKLDAAVTWSGKPAAPRTWATKESGYNAMGATICCRSLADNGAPCPEYPVC